MSTTTTEVKLSDTDREMHDDGSVKYTHRETGAWVRIEHDLDPLDPTQVGDSDMHVSYLEGSRYGNGEVEVPDDFRGVCPSCEGTGYSSERYELVPRGYFVPVVAAGTLSAMKFLQDRDTTLYLTGVECPRCKGDGEIEHLSGEAWLRATQGAIAVHKFDTGTYGEATAFMWTDSNEYTTPDEAVKAWAEQHRMWSDGDCWGFEAGDSRGEQESCWGFIGRETVEQEAQFFLNHYIELVQARVVNNIELGEN